LELKRALDFIPPKEKNWKIPVLLGSALNNEGLGESLKRLMNLLILKRNPQI
jgi:LAO/AO transport system kinase